MSSPTNDGEVKFIYVPFGESLPDSLDSDAIYFDANTQRLIAGNGDVSIYNPIVYSSSSSSTIPTAPKTVLLTPEQYDNLGPDPDPNTLYLIYDPDTGA